MHYTIIELYGTRAEPHRDDGPAVIYRDDVTGEIICEYYVHGHDMPDLKNYVMNAHPGIERNALMIEVDRLRATFGDPLKPSPLVNDPRYRLPRAA